MGPWPPPFPHSSASCPGSALGRGLSRLTSGPLCLADWSCWVMLVSNERTVSKCARTQPPPASVSPPPLKLSEGRNSTISHLIRCPGDILPLHLLMSPHLQLSGNYPETPLAIGSNPLLDNWCQAVPTLCQHWLASHAQQGICPRSTWVWFLSEKLQT